MFISASKNAIYTFVTYIIPFLTNANLKNTYDVEFKRYFDLYDIYDIPQFSKTGYSMLTSGYSPVNTVTAGPVIYTTFSFSSHSMTKSPPRR